MKTLTPHRSLRRIHSICNMTADQFAKLVGIGYSQLVACQQGRRTLSRADAKLIASATGADVSFNDVPECNAVKAFDGEGFSQDKFREWREVVLPGIREGAAVLHSAGREDAFEESLLGNVREILAAARVHGRDLAAAQYMQTLLDEVVEKFGIRQNLTVWKSFDVRCKRGKVTCAVREESREGVGRFPDFDAKKQFDQASRVDEEEGEPA